MSEGEVAKALANKFAASYRQSERLFWAALKDVVTEEREYWYRLIRGHCVGRRCPGCEAVAEAAGRARHGDPFSPPA